MGAGILRRFVSFPPSPTLRLVLEWGEGGDGDKNCFSNDTFIQSLVLKAPLRRRQVSSRITVYEVVYAVLQGSEKFVISHNFRNGAEFQKISIP